MMVSCTASSIKKLVVARTYKRLHTAYNIRMTKVVHYEGWQMECCGDPFKIGDHVEWRVGKMSTEEFDILGEYGDMSIDYYEDHHDITDKTDKDTFAHLSGKVTSIKYLYNIYEEINNTLYPRQAKVVPVNATTRLYDDMDEYRFNGLIVEVDQETVRPLTDDEYIKIIR